MDTSKDTEDNTSMPNSPDKRPDSQSSDMINSEYGTPVKEQITLENSLYNRCNEEMERLETQNNEYREKLLKTIRERDLNEELLRNVQGQHKKELEMEKRRIKDLEIQLKATTDKSTAQEAHFNVTTREMSMKYNTSVQQLTKKADQNEKDKNEAVVKYAMREGEMMKLKEEIMKKDGQLKVYKEELEGAKKSQEQENVDGLEKMVNNLKVEIETLKHEKFDIENRMKIAEKKVETLSNSLNETKQQCDVLRKQLIQAKDEKQIAQNNKIQMEHADLERRIREADSDIERLRTSQLEMATKFEESSRENGDLLTKIDILQDQMSLEEDRRKLLEEQIERLKGVESFVESSSHQIEETQKEKENADIDRKQAEEEAEECRKHAEKMLNLNQLLAEKNTELQRDLMNMEQINNKMKMETSELEGKIEELTKTTTVLKEENEDIRVKYEEDMKRLKMEMTQQTVVEMTNEEVSYKEKYEECTRMLGEAENRLTEEKNSYSAYKKKTHANMKELRSELSNYRKTSNSGTSDNHVLAPPSSDSVPSMSSRSRASSITSMDRVTTNSREDDVSSAAAEESKRIEIQQQQTNMQQIMIDKIVVLQRKLARRTEKCEFLEEHVRQCLEELQKKTRIIQHFALREEASLLMPSEPSIEKLYDNCEFIQVPVSRKGSAYALMGAMFTHAGEKKQLQLLTEVNSRLQAVIEDSITKNISLRSTVDTLSTENTRLSRENRLLTLSQSRSQDHE